MKTFQNLNQALIGMSRELINNGVARKTRGFDCIEINEPVIIKITNPVDRYVTIKERKWNKILPFSESIWIWLGMNDLNSLPGNYVNNLYNFSDNGFTWRAGYGPRIRSMVSIDHDYEVSKPLGRVIFSGNIKTTDQIKYVIESFKKDMGTRQAVIEIGEPVKDNFENDGSLKVTKDQPCTRLLNFQLRDGKLDLTVYIRSNDIIWGFSAVNVFNFTFIQEMVAGVLGVEVGNYYHVANNLHFYEDKLDMVSELSMLDEEDYESEFDYHYGFGGVDLPKLDSDMKKLYYDIKETQIDSNFTPQHYLLPISSDWYKVFQRHHLKSKITNFINPYLNRLFNGGN